MENFSHEPTDPETQEMLRYSSENTTQDAIKIIDRATQYDMHPDQYDEMKQTLNPEAELQERIPATVHDSVKKYGSKSSNHAKVVENEVGFLDGVGRQASFVWYNLVGKREDENEIQELQHRKFQKGSLPDHEEEYLTNLLIERDDKVKSFGLEGYEQVLGQAAGVAGDIVEAITENKALIATSTGLGAGIGGLTPFGPVGALAGAGTGISLGITSALALDAYRRISSASFDELGRMTDDKGEPLNLSQDTKENISVSLGVASGALEALTGGALAFGVKKLIGKKAITTIVKNTSFRAAADILGHATKTAAISGGEEVVSEIADLVSKNYAKGHASEEGLWNAMLQTADEIEKDPKVRERLGITALVGGLAGGGVATTTGAITVRRIKKTYDISNEEIQKQRVQTAVMNDALKALSNQDEVIKLSQMSVETELKKLSPEQMTEFRKDAFTEAGYTDKVWFSEKDIATIEENNPELAATIRDMDVTESSNSDTSSSAGIEAHQFLDLIDDTPTVSEYARLHPEAPNPLESKNLLERFNDAQTKRQELFESLGEGEKLTPEQVQTVEDLDVMVDEGVRAAGEQGYIEDAVTFTEGIEAVLPEKQVESFNEAQRNARVAVADQLVKEFEAKEIRTENKIVKLNEKIQKEAQLKRVENDLRIVEHFKPTEPDVKLEAHKKAGHSELAIDPEFLPEDLKEAYLTDPKLIKRKVFVEGGITLEESAALAGVKDGETLLKTLANAPTKQELITERKAKSAEVRKQVKESREKTVEARRNKIFDNLGKAHLEELKFMKQQEWPATKQGIKKVVLPLPKLPELNDTAKKVVAKTRVADLSPRQFNAAEKSLQKKSATHILKNEVEQAFATKEKAMLNNELTRESLKARGQINQAQNTLKRVTSKEGINTFKKAGMLNQVNQILELFDLAGTEPKAVRQDSYFEYLASLDEQGKSIIVPESLADVRQRGKDLSVEQYLRVTDRLKTLEHQAKTKNKLFKRKEQREKSKKLQTEEAVVEDAVLDLQTHPDYNTNKLKEVKNKNSKSIFLKTKENLGLLEAAQTNFKNVATQLDRETLGGKHYENLVQPMVNAETFKRSKTSDLVDHIKKISKDYGSKDFIRAFNDFVEIPEFKGFEHLGHGRMAKSDLWTLLSYMGDPQAKERIQNFTNPETGQKMNVETVQRVLDRVLTKKDAKLAQNFVNIFKSFEEEAADLHVRTTGVNPTMVKGVPITHRGKVLPGGYVPNNYLNTSPTEKVDRFLEILGDKQHSMFGSGKSDGKLYSRLRAAEMTDQGRLIDRNGSSRPLDTDFRNLLHSYEEHIHDLAYREAGTDVLKLLRNPVYSNGIISTVGFEKYSTMTSAVIETVGKSHGEDILNPFSEARQAAESAYRKLEQGFNIGTLGFKLSSVAMQPLSFGAAALRMGPTGFKYLTKSFGQVLANIGKGTYTEMFNRAVEINPDLKFNKDSIDDTLVKSTYAFIPKTTKAPFANKFAMLKRGQQHLIETSMLGLRKLDIHIKAAATNAAYAQFLDGNVKNFPQSKLDTMTEIEIDVAAKKYAKQVADLALTTSADIDKTAIEKISSMRIFTRFYTDLRSQLNTSKSQVRKIKNASKRAATDFKSGEITKGLSSTKEAALDVGSMLAVHTMMQMYIGALQKKETPITELANVQNMDDFKNFMGNTTAYVLGAPVKGIVDSTIIARDVQFALGSYRRNKTVGLPITKIFSDMTMSITGLADLLEGSELSKNQKKALLFTASYVGGGIPVKGPIEIVKAVEESEIFGDVGSFVRREANRLADNIKKYSEKNPKETEMIEHLKGIQTEIVPALEQDTEHIVPEDSLEVLKLNEWDDQDPDTKAAGIYQFTPERWSEISEVNPDLGLTEDGRVSKNPTEQERAMKWTNEQNARGLIAYQITVNNTNLYGAHRFGLDDYVAVSLAKSDEKLTNVVDDMSLFKGFKSVKQVRRYVNEKVKKN